MNNIPESTNDYLQEKSSDIHLTLLLFYDSFFSIIPYKFGDRDFYKFTLFLAHDMSPSHIGVGDENPMHTSPQRVPWLTAETRTKQSWITGIYSLFQQSSKS
jgi:hypothetical protein